MKQNGVDKPEGTSWERSLRPVPLNLPMAKVKWDLGRFCLSGAENKAAV